MFDRIDAVVYHPKLNATYFFRKDEYLKFVPQQGVQTLSGSKVRRIGVDGWGDLPEQFRSDIDAVLSHPNGYLYFFKGANYVKWEPGGGIVPTSAGETVRTIGVTGWTSFPNEFHSDIDAAIYYVDRGHAYFFKGDTYIKYKPLEGVVPIGDGQKIRRLGITGWVDLPDAFKQGIDAALYYPKNGKLYFFKEREYVRWHPGVGVDDLYPRRLGLMHPEKGGWPGLSTLLGGPFIGDVTSDSATVWLWLTGDKTTDDLNVRLDHIVVPDPEYLTPDLGTCTEQVREGVDGVDDRSMIRLLRLRNLTSNALHHVDLHRADDQRKIEEITFKTAPRPGEPARVRIGLGSCANHTKKADVNTFTALAKKQLDFLILCGDNCYYYDGPEGTTGKDGTPPTDWSSVTRMLNRQLAARNHPQFVPVARTLPVFSTWDDHEFSYNDCDGFQDKDDSGWVGRDCAAGVYRLMWNHPYRRDGNHIYYDFQWGPLHVFMTDGRYHSNRFGSPEPWILGTEQCAWLLDGLKSSDAPLKIIVFGSQLIRTTNIGGQSEGFANSAPPERDKILDTIMKEVQGAVLVFSGDVHFSECQRYPEESKAPKIVEVTSSPLRVRKKVREPPADPNRLWHTREESFAVIDINFLGVTNEGVNGSLRIEAFDENGKVLDSSEPPGKCRTNWNLLTGHLSLDDI
jgi:phosphodiesterase/alkaline phosphatase D-like protein